MADFKNLYILIITVVIISLISCSNEINYRQLHHLSDNVTEVVYSQFSTEQRFGEWVPKELQYKNKLYFNKNGKIQKEIYNYIGFGETSYVNIYDNDILIKVRVYDDDGKEFRRILVSDYSKNGYLFSLIDEDGEVLLIGNTVYSNNNFIHERVLDFERGYKHLSNRIISSENLLVKFEFFSESVVDSVFDDKSFDKLGNFEFKNDPSIFHYEYIKFDEFGNWISRLGFTEDSEQPESISIREIKYTD